MRSENAGFTKWRKVIAKLSCAPLVGCIASEAGRIGAAAGIGGRVVFADFSSRSPEKSFAKIATPRYFFDFVMVLFSVVLPSYFPIQKLEKIFPNRSSELIVPVISARLI